MAFPAWTNIPDSAVAVGAPLKSAAVMVALRDNARACRLHLFGVDIPEDTTTSGTPWDTVANSSFPVFVPDFDDYTGIVRQILLGVECKVTAGTTGYARLYNVTDAYGGTTSALISATSYAALELALPLASATLGGVLSLSLQFYRVSGAGSVYLQAVNAMTGRVEY